MKNIEWFVSAWDIESLDFLDQFNLKFNKIASAMIVDEDFLTAVAEKKLYTFISTGITIKDIEKAVSLSEMRTLHLSLCTVFPPINED